MKRGNCKSNPGMACFATVSCYKENFLKNHSCGGCCKEYIESLKVNPNDEYKIKKAASL